MTKYIIKLEVYLITCCFAAYIIFYIYSGPRVYTYILMTEDPCSWFPEHNLFRVGLNSDVNSDYKHSRDTLCELVGLFLREDKILSRENKHEHKPMILSDLVVKMNLNPLHVKCMIAP